MKETFEELYKILKQDRKNSSWSQKITLQQRHSKLLEEAHEIGQAIQKQDTQNLKEELGDTLWDLLALIIIAEEQGNFTAKDIINEAIQKIKRRKPWIFDNKKLTLEQEAQYWKEIKNKEKEVEK